MTKYSTNELAQKIVGKRNLPEKAIAFDQPCELGYHCPVCQYPIMHGNGMNCYDERLHWSEYNGFIWCEVCNKDYPSCFCIPFSGMLPGYVTKEEPIDYAIEIYLRSIDHAKKIDCKEDKP